MWKLYELYSNPLTRVVYGLPTSWEQSVASVGFPSNINTVVWSPCCRFIAVAWGRHEYGGTVEILDAGTLGQLSILPLYKQSLTRCLIFSPDTSLLTWIGQDPDWIISWDVQTGVLVSTISLESMGDYHSVTYSTCGTMIGLHSCNTSTSTISTYNILSGTHIYSHSVKRLKLEDVWTHGKCLRYGVMKSRTITIWEVGFTSIHTLTKVESLSLPANFHSKEIPNFYPALSLVVFSYNGKGYIWDAKYSKYLLGSTDLKFCKKPSFSSDGSSFAYEAHGSRVHIWKQSPAGYACYQRLTSISCHSLYLSPNGQLLFTHSITAAQLWCITNSNIPNLTIPTQASKSDKRSPLLVFSPDQVLAAVTKKGEKTVTVLDLKSGAPRMIIDAGIEVCGLGVAGGTIVVAGNDVNTSDKKIVTWNIPTGDCVLIIKANMDDSVKTIAFGDQPNSRIFSLSVSPDLHYIISMEPSGLHLYDVLTGQCLASVDRMLGNFWFTQDGCRIWCISSSYERGWKIVKDGESGVTRLEHLESTKDNPPRELPWRCPPSYKVTDGWILHSNGKRLLRLPPHWWPRWYDVVWGGQFLALLNSNLPEILILELE